MDLPRTSGPSVVVEQSTITIHGLDFHVATAGPIGAPLVVLLHGFPELSYGWRQQIGPLAAAGLRVAVPDQRGYGHSAKPPGTAAYGVDVLVNDVLGLADALGYPSLSIVGHDWGGIVAWRLAADHGHRVDRLAILNAPNLDVVRTHLLHSPSQLLRSGYVAFFQVPWLPELALSAMDYRLLAAALTGSSNPATFADDELAVYRRAWSAPGALTAMLNWYRALPSTPHRTARRIATPTCILWGDRDTALERSLAEDSAALCDDVAVRHFPDATHWLHHEEPKAVNEALIAFLTSGDAVR